MRNKFGNKKTMIDGVQFDSKTEAMYYLVLKDMRNKGEIYDLQLQPRFELQPAYTTHDGRKIQKIEYVADFAIEWPDGRKWIIDVKGVETKEFQLKAKMFEFQYVADDSRRLVIIKHHPIHGFVTKEELQKLKRGQKNVNGKEVAKSRKRRL